MSVLTTAQCVLGFGSEQVQPCSSLSEARLDPWEVLRKRTISRPRQRKDGPRTHRCRQDEPGPWDGRVRALVLKLGALRAAWGSWPPVGTTRGQRLLSESSFGEQSGVRAGPSAVCGVARFAGPRVHSTPRVVPMLLEGAADCQQWQGSVRRHCTAKYGDGGRTTEQMEALLLAQ